MKEVLIDGRIGKDAEVLSTKNGKSYVRFSVANDTYANGEHKTEWFDVTSFDPYTIESRTKYLTKGRSVIVSGALSTDVTVRDGGKVWLNQRINAKMIELQMTSSNKEEQTAEQVNLTTNTMGNKQEATQEPAYATIGEPKLASDDDLPF